MDTARYIVAVLVVVMLPPAFVYWYVAHPLAKFWRRQSPWVTYGILLGGMFVMIATLFGWRSGMVGIDLGFSPWLVAAGVVLYGASIVIEVQCRKHLTFKILVGLPELAPDRMESKLLQDGIYGRVRHPRYLGVMLGTLGWALASGYSGAIAIALLTVPALYLVTVFEERELLERLGDEYAEYRARVPRLFPRFG